MSFCPSLQVAAMFMFTLGATPHAPQHMLKVSHDLPNSTALGRDVPEGRDRPPDELAESLLVDEKAQSGVFGRGAEQDEIAPYTTEATRKFLALLCALGGSFSDIAC